MQATIVFEKIWNAIHALDENGKRKYKYIINTGSSRSSKTYSILQTHWLISLSRPNTRVSIWRETKADCKMTVLADLKKASINFPSYNNVIFNKTESTYTFQNNSTIELMGGDEENRVHGFQGDVAHLNEPYKFSLEAFNQIDMRTSEYIIIDWNPKGKHWIDELSKRDNAIVIHSTYKDNPFVPEEQKKKIESYLPLKMSQCVLNNTLDFGNAFDYDFETNTLKLESNQLKELKRAIHNEQQGTADEYLHSVYALGLKAEKPNRIFRNWIKVSDAEFTQLTSLPSYYGLDFGLSSPSALVEMKFDGDKHIYYRERMYKPMNEMKGTLSDEFENLGIDKRRELVVDSGNELNKQEGIKLMNNGYNVVFAKKGKGSIVTGIELMQKKIIHYTNESINLEQEYENHSWKMYQGIQLDEPEQGNDHIIDACKYVIVWYCQTRGID